MLAEIDTQTESHRPRRPDFPAPAGVYPAIKAAADFLLALVLCAPAAPLILLAAALVKLTSRGPAFYSQTRLGLGGRPYKIYKVRTMAHNCEKVSGARWAVQGDPRITPVGRFLRKTHLDELPQLWNVLKGNMSLVGPRPERPEFVPALEQQVHGYRDRLRVRPGVTGLAQVQLPADTDVESVRRKLTYDLYYIEHMSFWLDLRLVLGTALKVVHVPFAVSQRLLRLPDRRAVEEGRTPTDPGDRPVQQLRPEVA
jgi:lipopolysaccharide/colanic/teichoic acid biosynthesis glycosyltransferase